MAGVGGLVLLVGLLYFAWYSIQRGWISPAVRLSATGVLGLVAMAGAWKLAPRGQASVAAGLGGAGLGAWFGAILAARHSHGLLEPTTTLLLLALGAGLGLAIATYRGLRFFAVLAALGALLTQPAVGWGERGPSELLAYQLVVVLFLTAIEYRRRWPELGQLATFGSWLLFLAWSAERSAAGRTDVLVWALVYLGVLHGANGALSRAGRTSPLAAFPRFAVTAHGAWLLAAMGAGEARGDLATLAVCIGNALAGFGLLRLFLRAPESARRAVRFGRAACIGACLSAAWIQLVAFGGLRWDAAGSLVWWTLLALAGATLQGVRPRVSSFLAFGLPFFLAVRESTTNEGPLFAALGLLVAALPLALGLLPGRSEVEAARRTYDVALASLLVLGGLAWVSVTGVHTEELAPPAGWHVAACVLVLVPILLRVLREPTDWRLGATLLGLLSTVILGFERSSSTLLFQASPGTWPPRTWQVASLVVVALLAHVLGASCRARMEEGDASRGVATVHDGSGLVRAAALVLASMLVVPGLVAAWTDGGPATDSLKQAGWSVTWALGGLALLVRGLRQKCVAWRKAGVLALFVTAGKLVVVDLVRVSMLWRVLSFVGLGLCLLAGAYAYRRLGAGGRERMAG